MATTYKTPGVYIEEIPKFPPSVAPVDTAIPAFIGYTEKAVDRDGSDLTLKPKRIESLVEFEQYFGGPQLETGDHGRHRRDDGRRRPASRSASRRPRRSTEADRSKHILYYAMQLFYANGGKSCYIVSVGAYKARRRRPVRRRVRRPGCDPAGQGRRADADRHPGSAGALNIGDFRTLQTRRARRSARTCKDRFVIMDVHGERRVAVGRRTATCSTAVSNFRDNGSAPATSTTAPPTRPTSRPCSTSPSTRRRCRSPYSIDGAAQGRGGRPR